MPALRTVRTLIGATVIGVLTLTGCGINRAVIDTSEGRPSTGTTKVVVRGYSFVPGGIETNSWSRNRQASRMDGVLAVPGTPGPHPVVFILPGSYATCIDDATDTWAPESRSTIPWPDGCAPTEEGAPNDEGFTQGADYIRWPASFAGMARALAEKGVIAVAIDNAVKDSLNGGEPDAQVVNTTLIAEHRKLLEDFNRGNTHGLDLGDTKGRFDLDNVGIVGHSSAGGFALQQLDNTRIAGLRAVVALQPAVNSPLAKRAANPLPTMLIGSRCDEQVQWNEHLELRKDLQARGGTEPLIFASTEQTGHLSQVGGGNPDIGLVHHQLSADCARDRLAEPGAVRSQSDALVSDFFAAAFSGTRGYSFRVGELQTSAESGGPAATVDTHRSTLPEDLPADQVTFQTIDERPLGEMPKADQTKGTI